VIVGKVMDWALLPSEQTSASIVGKSFAEGESWGHGHNKKIFKECPGFKVNSGDWL
jgi:hypothetical protein